MPFCRKGYKKPEARTRKVLIQLYNIKSTACAVLFGCGIECWGYPPWDPDQRNFSRKASWNFKSFAKINWYIRCESSLVYLSFKKGKRRRFGTEFQHITTNKKTRHCRVFLCWHYQLGISVPNPDQRNFSGKVSWNFKSSAKIKRCVLCKVLWRTFLSRKVRSGKVEFCKSAVGGLPVSCGHIFAGFIHCFHDKVE